MGKTFDPEKYEMTFCPFARETANYPSPLRSLRFPKNVEVLGSRKRRGN